MWFIDTIKHYSAIEKVVNYCVDTSSNTDKSQKLWEKIVINKGVHTLWFHLNSNRQNECKIFNSYPI